MWKREAEGNRWQSDKHPTEKLYTHHATNDLDQQKHVRHVALQQVYCMGTYLLLWNGTSLAAPFSPQLGLSHTNNLHKPPHTNCGKTTNCNTPTISRRGCRTAAKPVPHKVGGGPWEFRHCDKRFVCCCALGGTSPLFPSNCLLPLLQLLPFYPPPLPLIFCVLKGSSGVAHHVMGTMGSSACGT